MPTIKPLYLACVFIFCLAASAAAQSYMDIRKYNNTYEINVIPGRPPEPGETAPRDMNKCQAVRLSKEWFLTAAHCLQGACRFDGCTLQARLIVGQNYEMDWQTYASSANDEAIKIYKTYGDEKDDIAYDLALIKFPAGKSDFLYSIDRYVTPESVFKSRTKISDADFKHAKEGGNFPTLLQLNAEDLKLLNRTLVVVSIWGSSAGVMHSIGPVYYSPKKRFLFTQNFGIIQGISGSGVFTSTGELVGVVSSTGELRSGALRYHDYTFFTVFNKNAIDFITRNAGSVRRRETSMPSPYFSAVPFVTPAEQATRQLAFAIEESVK